MSENASLQARLSLFTAGKVPGQMKAVEQSTSAEFAKAANVNSSHSEIDASQMAALCKKAAKSGLLALTGEAFSGISSDSFLRFVNASVREIQLGVKEMRRINTGSDNVELLKLKRFDCSRCGVISLATTGWPGLETLVASGNKLTTVPKLVDSQKLIHLDLSGNELEERFANLEKLTSLRVLDLGDNNLEMAPNEFYQEIIVRLKNMARLEYLSLAGNPSLDKSCPDLKYVVIYHVPKLKYFNWLPVTKDMRAMAAQMELKGLFDQFMLPLIGGPKKARSKSVAAAVESAPEDEAAVNLAESKVVESKNARMLQALLSGGSIVDEDSDDSDSNESASATPAPDSPAPKRGVSDPAPKTAHSISSTDVPPTVDKKSDKKSSHRSSHSSGGTVSRRTSSRLGRPVNKKRRKRVAPGTIRDAKEVDSVLKKLESTADADPSVDPSNATKAKAQPKTLANILTTDEGPTQEYLDLVSQLVQEDRSRKRHEAERKKQRTQRKTLARRSVSTRSVRSRTGSSATPSEDSVDSPDLKVRRKDHHRSSHLSGSSHRSSRDSSGHSGHNSPRSSRSSRKSSNASASASEVSGSDADAFDDPDDEESLRKMLAAALSGDSSSGGSGIAPHLVQALMAQEAPRQRSGSTDPVSGTISRRSASVRASLMVHQLSPARKVSTKKVQILVKAPISTEDDMNAQSGYRAQADEDDAMALLRVLTNNGTRAPVSVTELGASSKLLGDGPLGQTVRAAYWKAQRVFTKRWHFNTKLDIPGMARISAEVDRLVVIPRHANLVPVVGAVEPQADGIDVLSSATGTTDAKPLNTFMPISDSEAADSITRHQLRERILVARSVAAGVAYLHNNGVVHLSLKPSNVLVSKQALDAAVPVCDNMDAAALEALGTPALVSDYGFAPVKLDRLGAGEIGLGEFDRAFVAPELRQAASQGKTDLVTSAADVFSFGVLLYYLFSNGHRAGLQALAGDDTERPALPACPVPIQKLIAACWAPEHMRRPGLSTVTQILMQPIGRLAMFGKAPLSTQDEIAHSQATQVTEPRDEYDERLKAVCLKLISMLEAPDAASQERGAAAFPKIAASPETVGEGLLPTAWGRDLISALCEAFAKSPYAAPRTAAAIALGLVCEHGGSIGRQAVLSNSAVMRSLVSLLQGYTNGMESSAELALQGFKFAALLLSSDADPVTGAPSAVGLQIGEVSIGMGLIDELISAIDSGIQNALLLHAVNAVAAATSSGGPSVIRHAVNAGVAHALLRHIANVNPAIQIRVTQGLVNLLCAPSGILSETEERRLINSGLLLRIERQLHADIPILKELALEALVRLARKAWNTSLGHDVSIPDDLGPDEVTRDAGALVREKLIRLPLATVAAAVLAPGSNDKALGVRLKAAQLLHLVIAHDPAMCEQVGTASADLIVSLCSHEPEIIIAEGFGMIRAMALLPALNSVLESHNALGLVLGALVNPSQVIQYGALRALQPYAWREDPAARAAAFVDSSAVGAVLDIAMTADQSSGAFQQAICVLSFPSIDADVSQRIRDCGASLLHKICATAAQVGAHSSVRVSAIQVLQHVLESAPDNSLATALLAHGLVRIVGNVLLSPQSEPAMFYALQPTLGLLAQICSAVGGGVAVAGEAGSELAVALLSTLRTYPSQAEVLKPGLKVVLILAQAAVSAKIVVDAGIAPILAALSGSDDPIVGMAATKARDLLQI